MVQNRLILLILLIFISPSSARSEDFSVSNVEELYTAIARANQNRQPDRIFLEDGKYLVTKRLVFSEPDTQLMSRSAKPERVVLSGNGMRQSDSIEILIDVHTDNITVSGITLTSVSNHLIQVRAEKNADNFVLTNSVLQDAFEQLLKVSGGAENGIPHADNGWVETCVFEYTAGIGPQYYIGGIDAHRAHNWTIKNNTFRGIASPSKHIAEHAVHLWNDSKDNRVIGNIFINNDRSVGFGLNNRQQQHSGGEISYNTFVHFAEHHPFADASIILESSPNTKIIENVIVQEHKYPNAIEYRFEHTKNVLISNNRVNRKIRSRNGGEAILTNNQRIN